MKLGARQCRWSRLPFQKRMNPLRGKDSRGGEEKHAETDKNFAGKLGDSPAGSASPSLRTSRRYKMGPSARYFLKRLSKAWRASSGREGAAASAMADCWAGC